MKTYFPRRLVLVACAVLTACTTVQTTGSGTVGVTRTQQMSMLVSASQIEAQAAAFYSDEVRKSRANGVLNTDVALTQRVRNIGARLIPHVAVFNPAAPGWTWEINVKNNNDLNAWCAAGGKIMFYTGIINRLRLTDDEIAAVMGHEMAHALREHSRERASAQMNAQLGLTLLQVATRSQQVNSQAADMAKLLYILPNSRTHETEADRMGIELMARAGYDPRAAISVWHKMSAATGGRSGPEYMSTHPSHSSRISDLTQYEQLVRPLHQVAVRQGGPASIVPVAAAMVPAAPVAAPSPVGATVAPVAVPAAAASGAARPATGGYTPAIPNPSMFRRN